jgi:hypothetical protein
VAFDVVSTEQLRHNPLNEVTGGLDRVTDQAGRTLIRKRLCPPQPAARNGAANAGLNWSASADPRHWNYWRREAEAYRSAELRASLDRAGLAMPGGTAEESPGGATLWLEDVAGTPGTEFTSAEHAALSRAAGRWQAQGPLLTPWTSRRFLRDYSTTRVVAWHLLDDDDAWQQPLVRDNWPPELRAGWQRMVAYREFLLDLMERLPRTRSHLDFWVANQIMRPTGEVVLVDWAFAGDGAVGEDVGNHVPDAVNDLFWPAERIAELDQVCFEAYLDGLREAGWAGRDSDARLGMVASCVKYAWLLPFMLERAANQRHGAYHRPADSAVLYRTRGMSLTFLTGWLDEALALAGRPG